LGLLVCSAAAVLTYTILARVLRLHQGRHLVGSFDELLPLAGAVGVVAAAVTLLNALSPGRMVPLTAPLIAAPVVLVLAGTVRCAVRTAVVHESHRLHQSRTTRALIVGAGETGRSLADSMQRDPSSVWEPVAFLDDDRKKRF